MPYFWLNKCQKVAVKVKKERGDSLGNNPMVGATVAVAVAIEQAQ